MPLARTGHAKAFDWLRARIQGPRCDRRAKVWFDGTINLGDTFDAEAAAAGDNKLKANTFVHVFDGAGNLLQTVKFHTSCSQPLRLDDTFGSIVLRGFVPE